MTGEMLPQVKLSCRLSGVGSATDIDTTPTYRQKETIYWNLGLSADALSSKKTVAFTELAGGVTYDQATVDCRRQSALLSSCSTS